jgi:hypothetical protein
MSEAEWNRAYHLAWKTYYTIDHIETVLRRVAATPANAGNALFLITCFKGCIEIEKIHPLEGGVLRCKSRRDRRPGMPIISAWRFYPAYFFETATKLGRWLALYIKLRRIYLRIKHDPRRYEYSDDALTPVTDSDIETYDLFHPRTARDFVALEPRIDKQDQARIV